MREQRETGKKRSSEPASASAKPCTLDQVIAPEVLQRLLKAFSLATGLGATLVDVDGKPIFPENFPGLGEFCQLIRSTPEGLRRCQESMAKAGQQAAKLGEPYIYRCHAGLIEWAAPVVFKEAHLGSFLCGQVLMWPLDEIALTEILARTADLGLSPPKLMLAAKELRGMSGSNVQAAAELLFIIATHIVETGLLTLMQRRELNEQQARLAEEIHARKRAEERLEHLEGVCHAELGSLYPLEKEKALLNRVRLGDRPGAKEILNEILGEILFRSFGQPEVLKARLLELSVVLSRAAVEAGARLDMLLGLNFNFLQEISSLERIEELCAWIVKVLDRFMDALYEVRDCKNIKVLQEVVDFIHAHFAEELTLESVAREVHLSPFYLSHLLKEEIGYTFVEYLTRVRLEEAKRLLRETRAGTLEIAERVGYKDASYFSKVFRKKEGKTPGQYRKQTALSPERQRDPEGQEKNLVREQEFGR